MHKSFGRRLSEIIEEADILFEVIDARFAELMRNEELEQRIKWKRKKLAFLLNKCDLIEEKKCEELKNKMGRIAPTIFVSAKNRDGIRKIKELIGILSEGKNAKVGFIGYPNTGKSSLINALAGRKVARTSIKAGLTRGEQFIRLNDTIKLIDSPGVFPMDEFDEAKLALFSAKGHEQLKDPEYCAEYLIKYLKEFKPKALEKFGIQDINKDENLLLEEIALNKKKMRKGGIPDVKNAAKMILLQWQKGLI